MYAEENNGLLVMFVIIKDKKSKAAGVKNWNKYLIRHPTVRHNTNTLRSATTVHCPKSKFFFQPVHFTYIFVLVQVSRDFSFRFIIVFLSNKCSSRHKVNSLARMDGRGDFWFFLQKSTLLSHSQNGQSKVSSTSSYFDLVLLSLNSYKCKTNQLGAYLRLCVHRRRIAWSSSWEKNLDLYSHKNLLLGQVEE